MDPPKGSSTPLTVSNLSYPPSANITDRRDLDRTLAGEMESQDDVTDQIGFNFEKERRSYNDRPSQMFNDNQKMDPDRKRTVNFESSMTPSPTKL